LQDKPRRYPLRDAIEKHGTIMILYICLSIQWRI